MKIILPEHLYQREALETIKPFIAEDNILLLTGARQTGKTSLLYLLIKDLWNGGVSPSQTVYFDLENIHDFNQLDSLSDFNSLLNVLRTTGVDLSKRVYLFIDEIQHLSNPSSFLKYLHDHHKPLIKFIVSGSSSLEIKKKFSDRLTGRIYHFLVKPLNFREYLFFRDERHLADLLSDIQFSQWLSGNPAAKKMAQIAPSEFQELNESIQDYLRFGGYPGVVLKQNPHIRIKDLQEIYTLYVRRDIRDLGNILDVAGYNKLVSLLALQIGNIVKENELAVSTGLSRPTIKNYLFLLENTFVIQLVPPYFTNKRKEIIKASKVFFEDVGIRNGVMNNFSALENRTDRGVLLENFIFSQLSKQADHPENLKIWRTQNQSEVDFVWQNRIDEPIPIEVKWFFNHKQKLPAGLKSFIVAYHPKQAFIIHGGDFFTRRFRDTSIYVLPAWAV